MHRTGGIRRALLALAMLALLTSPGPAAASCEVVVPDEEIHCTYRPVRPQHDLVFLDTDSGEIRTARARRPRGGSRVVLEPFFDLGWTPGVATVAPGLERLLVARSKPSCPPFQRGPGPGLDCSYGRPTLWLAEHRVNDPANPADDLWVHLNLSRRLLGRNSEIHGWTTWLHDDLALFNAVVFPDEGGWYNSPATGYRQKKNAAQIYAVRFDAAGRPTIERYAPGQLWRRRCLTTASTSIRPRSPSM